jgi:hypothetical protein
MNQFTPSDLFKLKQKLQQTKSTHDNHNKLIIKREEFQRTIDQLKEELENQKFLLHLKEEKEPKSVLQKEMENTAKRLEQATQEKRKIDHLLDDYELLCEEGAETLKEKLIEGLLELYPLQREEQLSREKNLLIYLQDRKNLSDLRSLGQELQTILHHVLATRQNIRGWGLLNYVVGRSPNAVIASSFQAGSSLIEKELPYLKNLQEETESKERPFYTIWYLFLNNLNGHFKVRWGFRHIDQIIAKAQKELSLLLIATDEKVAQAEQEIERVQNEINSWIENTI